MRIVSTAEMKEIESRAFGDLQISESLIIENVGIQSAQYILENFLANQKFEEIVFLVGKGNNGADALACARHLTSKGHTTRAFLLFAENEWSHELSEQVKLARVYGVKFSEVKNNEQVNAYFKHTQNEFLVIDGILGTGLQLPISNYLFEIINVINDSPATIISIDIPSGISGDRGEKSSVAIKADYTLAIGLPKTGHFVSDGALHSGQVQVLDAGFPPELFLGGNKALLTEEGVASSFHKRNKFAHKNTFGHALVLGGSPGKTGALIMAASAALKSGTGLVTAATWRQSYGELTTRIIPEIMTGLIPISEEENPEIVQNLDRFDSIVIGPGLGKGEYSRKVITHILDHYSGPLVIDADAINVLDLEKDVQRLNGRKALTVLTPHVGEFVRLTGKSKEEVLMHPMDHIRELVEKINCTVILKGASTYLGFPNGHILINYFPNDGLASGGSGDVLAGILGGMVAQTYSQEEKVSSGMFKENRRYYEAICVGVMAHTLAGKHAVDLYGARSMTAGSLIEFLSEAFFDLEKTRLGGDI